MQAEIKQLTSENELLKKDNLLMGNQIEHCERQFEKQKSMLIQQSGVEVQRVLEDIKKKEIEIANLKTKSKARKQKLTAAEAQAEIAKGERQ